VAQLLVDDSSSLTQAACLDLLERNEVVINLQEVRTDGWFERIGENISNFDKLCDLIGFRFLAYSIILGIQIRSLTLDPLTPANTTVEFSGDDALLQTLPLNEFQVRVVQALLRLEQHIGPISLPLTDDKAVELIGQVFLFAAPLFDLSLKRLVWVPDSKRGVIGFVSASGFNFMDLIEFKAMIKQKLHRDLAGTMEDPFQLDLTAVEQSRAAAKLGEHEKVIAALETWPGLLTTLQRSSAKHNLNEQQLDMIGEGLLLLGDAFRAKERFTWSEELYRLGLQFTREGSRAAQLFFKLGLLLNDRDRYGEAIGLLRRSLSLGLTEEEVYPALSDALLGTGRYFSAAIILDELLFKGNSSRQVAARFARAKLYFKEAGVKWPFRSE